jgi:uncharacterized protein (TIGR00730 family)
MADQNEHFLPLLSFLNPAFLKSPAARIVRIISEYIEPAERLRRAQVHDTIVFFGSARSVPKLARYYDDAAELARRLTEWSKSLTGNRDFIICSGGSGGMMEAANRGAAMAGGKTMGLTIQLEHEEAANSYVPRELLFHFHYFFMRKFWFVYPAKALVIFPGGFGTLDEFFEVLTLIQTAKPRKVMPVVLFGAEYWNEVINFDAMVRWGTVSAKDLDIFRRTDSVDDAYAYLTSKLEGLYMTPEGLDQIKLT